MKFRTLIIAMATAMPRFWASPSATIPAAAQRAAPDSAIVVRVSVRAKRNLDRPIVGVTFRDQRGVDLAGSNTESEGYPLLSVDGG